MIEDILIGGGLGGALAAAAANILTTFIDRGAGSEAWLKGPYGPPFFNVALFMGLLYGGIALALTRRRQETAIGALGPFLGILLPMLILTRATASLPWVPVVIAVFVAAVWGTIFALGWRMAGRRWLGGVAAVAGAFLGYLLLQGLAKVFPVLSAWHPHSYLPTPAVMLDGALTGAGIGLGISLLRRSHASNA